MTFEQVGNQIWAKSEVREGADGERRGRITFPVAQVNDDLGDPDKIAQMMVRALNESGLFEHC